MKTVTVTMTRAEANAILDNMDDERFDYFRDMARNCTKGSKERRDWLKTYNTYVSAGVRITAALYGGSARAKRLTLADLDDDNR